MDATLASAVIGVPLSVSITAFAIAFARLRSEMHAGLDRLEACFDDLIAAVDRNGRLVDPDGSGADD